MYKLLSFKMLKGSKSTIYPILLLLFIVILIFVIRLTLNANLIPKSEFTILNKSENISYITAKGEIDSNTSTEVYSPVNNTVIKCVNVKQGDIVKQNDLLATLDDSNIQYEIKQLQASIKTSDEINNSNLLSAKEAYDSALYLSDENTNNEIITATSALDAASLDLDNKQYLYECYLALYENDAISEKDFYEYKINYENAKNNYTNAVANLNSIKESVSLNLSKTKSAYDNAVAQCNDNTKQLQLTKKENDLKQCNITAPYDGIITEVNISAGSSNTGCLFKIADTKDLISTAKVKEADISKIKLGQTAEINTDSVSDSTIKGTVIAIKQVPKEDENALNLNDDSEDEDSEYEVHIKLNTHLDKLKIGMKTKVNIITEKKEGVFIIPSESIAKDENNNNFIFVAEPLKQKHSFIVKKLPITLGTESDSDSEIINKKLCDGTIVLNTPLNYKDGDKIKLDLR